MYFLDVSVTTEAPVTSLPVPAVVGMAIKGRIGFGSLSGPSYCWIGFGLVERAPIAFAVSIALPPPIPTMKSPLQSSRAEKAVFHDFHRRVGFDPVEYGVLQALFRNGLGDSVQQTSVSNTLVRYDQDIPATHRTDFGTDGGGFSDPEMDFYPAPKKQMPRLPSWKPPFKEKKSF